MNQKLRKIFVSILGINTKDTLDKNLIKRYRELQSQFEIDIHHNLLRINFLNEWVILFLEVSPDTNAFSVEIYTDTEKEYHAIVEIIKYTLNEPFNLHFLHLGDVSTYTQSQ